MKKTNFKLALAAATSAVVMLSGVTTANAAELRLAAQQPTIAGEINTILKTGCTWYGYRPGHRYLCGSIEDISRQPVPRRPKKALDTKSSAAKKYKQYLEKQQAEVLKNAGSAFGRKLDTFIATSMQPMVSPAIMTAAEAKALRNVAGVQRCNVSVP